MNKNLKKMLPYIIFFILLLVIHLFMNFSGDDTWFAKQLSNQTLFKFLNFRYHNWTSRLIIETLLTTLTRTSIYVWRILDTLIYTIGAYCIIKLINPKKNKDMILLGLALIFIYPYEKISSAGWVATTLNYSWCFVGGMLAFLPLIKKSQNEKVNVFIYIISIIGLLYAVNQEQACALIFGFNFLYLLNSIFKTKKIDKYNIFALIISTISLVFILTCPGNAVRTTKEITTWYPEFAKFGILQKTYLGFLPTVGMLLENKYLMAIFYTILGMSVALKTNKKAIKIFAYMSIILVLSITIFEPLLLGIYPKIETSLSIFKLTQIPSIKDKYTLVALALSAYISLSICVMLYMVYGKKNLLPLMIFVAGFMSRFIVGFSPTIFVSGPRTALFLNLMIVILTLMLVGKLYEEKKINQRWDLIIKIVFIGLAICTYINTFIVI